MARYRCSASVASARRQFLERIEHLQAGPAEVLIVAGHDRQTVPPGGGGNVAVLHGHALAVFLQQVLLVSPDVSDRNVEAENAPAESVHQPAQPVLQIPALTDRKRTRLN